MNGQYAGYESYPYSSAAAAAAAGKKRLISIAPTKCWDFTINNCFLQLFSYNRFTLGTAAGYMTPYTYTALPQSAAAVAAANGIHGLSLPYQGLSAQNGAALQEARLQWLSEILIVSWNS